MLFLCHRIPYPPDKGDKIRAWNMFVHLSRRFDMHVGCFVDDPADQIHEPRLRAMCADLACVPLGPWRQKLRALLAARPGRPLTRDYFRDAAMRRWVEAKLADSGIEHVFVFSSGMADYVLDHERDGMVLDMVDVDSEKWRDYGHQARGVARLFWAREARTLLEFERLAASHFSTTLFVSEHEMQRFATLAPESSPRLDWVENGVDLDYFSPERSFPTPFADGAPHLVFTGTMDYWPNADGVTWFVRHVMPLLARRSPGLRLSIVGANPTPKVRALSGPGVEVTGRVADVRPYLAHAAAVVAPLRIARGVQNKVLEAMAMARPVIATPEAFEGVRAQADRDVLVAGDAAAMARRVDEVLDGAHPGIGAAARAAVQRHHAWPITLRRLDRLFDRPPTAAAAPDAPARAAVHP
ncbi:MAG: TIGR03087 family PEP-CTERM/XrtA system glycosyltransferase [Rhodospirillales bacterium]|nr:TIGR03087 family PEP-CTERM/XrtA system glycosyltransferase [Rhodospirillales bacterium]MDE2198453.1 TIGR03087 family PEP-CTERM/XrtA system glycosyltransferase [Rhodospirillales bacterium]MDE2576732.1 TIGR03087 family PEP-CTERM/XrtA system glycosyltransferase [Rhodospirillales bacterium]